MNGGQGDDIYIIENANDFPVMDIDDTGLTQLLLVNKDSFRVGNGVGIDDDEVRTGNAMILDPYGRILAETSAAADAMVVADLDASLLEYATGRLWIRARRPELYGPLTQRTGQERSTREIKFQQ